MLPAESSREVIDPQAYRVVSLSLQVELSPIEWQALEYVKEGKSDQEIVDALKISPLTLRALFSKLYLNVSIVGAIRSGFCTMS